jgi:hypothetical protein
MTWFIIGLVVGVVAKTLLPWPWADDKTRAAWRWLETKVKEGW